AATAGGANGPPGRGPNIGRGGTTGVQRASEATVPGAEAVVACLADPTERDWVVVRRSWSGLAGVGQIDRKYTHYRPLPRRVRRESDAIAGHILSNCTRSASTRPPRPVSAASEWSARG